jgi:hypothetical protein
VNAAQDPFREHARAAHRRQLRILGAPLEVTSNSRELLALVDAAFGGLPAHRLRARAPRSSLHLWLDGESRRRASRMPALRLRSRDGLLFGGFDAENFAVINPRGRSALVCAAPALLRAPYYLRYELIEFAVLTLLPRVHGLLPLHAAAVAWGSRGALLCGDSGAGKSTLSVACLQQGLSLLGEDAVFVDANSLRATGCANYLHLGGDSLRFVGRELGARFRASPVIRRRSGALKFELDARAAGLPLAKKAPRLEALVVLSKRQARGDALLRALSAREAGAALRRLQPYAARQPGWQDFQTAAAGLPAFRLLRGASPADGAAAVRALLERR